MTFHLTFTLGDIGKLGFPLSEKLNPKATKIVQFSTRQELLVMGPSDDFIIEAKLIILETQIQFSMEFGKSDL